MESGRRFAAPGRMPSAFSPQAVQTPAWMEGVFGSRRCRRVPAPGKLSLRRKAGFGRRCGSAGLPAPRAAMAAGSFAPASSGTAGAPGLTAREGPGWDAAHSQGSAADQCPAARASHKKVDCGRTGRSLQGSGESGFAPPRQASGSGASIPFVLPVRADIADR